MPFSRAQWVFWAFGLLASAAVLFVIGMGKGGPDWYAPVFVAAAVYCLAAQAVSIVIRRRGRSESAASWTAALATSRLGLLVLIALGVVVVALYAFRSWR